MMQMKQTAQDLFSLLRLAIGTAGPEDGTACGLRDLPLDRWQAVLALAEGQGVDAVAFDGVQRLYGHWGAGMKAVSDTPREWMRWVLGRTARMAQHEQRCRRQREVIAGLSAALGEEGIRMMVFKGQACASLYPEPMHRATGDVDCYLFGEAARGDAVMARHGARIDTGWYRHSVVAYGGETIENHRVMSHTRGSRRKKMMEEELEAMLRPGEMKAIAGCGEALMPTPQFSACFLTYHALHHFLSEGLRMKQVLDWAVFLQSEQGRVDWESFGGFCRRYRLDRFAGAMNDIAATLLGVRLAARGIPADGSLTERVIQDTLYGDGYLFNSGKGDWKVRWLLVRNMLTRDRWKYRDVARQNVWAQLWNSAAGFLLEKD